ncbi:MAG: hypothetical protein ACUVTL_01230 [Thermoproteota archaeon]
MRSRAIGSWSESTITWNNQSGVDSISSDTVIGTTKTYGLAGTSILCSEFYIRRSSKRDKELWLEDRGYI